MVQASTLPCCQSCLFHVFCCHTFQFLNVQCIQGFVMRGSGQFPALEAWFDAMESRPTYLGTKSDHYTQ
jgi:hypothetical protein